LLNGNDSERAGWLASLRTEYEASLRAPAQNSPVDMAAVMRHLQDVLPDDVIITHGAGNFALWPDKCFAFGRGQRLLGPQSGAMGYGFPAALAACVAYPERMVVCFAGDGDIQMGIAELGSAVQEGAKPLILVLNNGSYGTIRMHQERDYPGRVSGTTLVNPDFTAVAEAYGMMGIKVARTEEFAAAFKTLSDAPHGGILELDISLEAITPTKKLSEL
jgi:acetolactate synthase-1/2/3 large subunit